MKKLKYLRKKHGYSTEYIAKRVNISQTYYWQIENKKRRLYYNIALKIAKVFKLKPDEIFYDDAE